MGYIANKKYGPIATPPNKQKNKKFLSARILLSFVTVTAPLRELHDLECGNLQSEGQMVRAGSRPDLLGSFCILECVPCGAANFGGSRPLRRLFRTRIYGP